MRLMTSLVTQSLNSLSLGIVAVQEPQLGENSSMSPHASFASFALTAVIEITKRNCFRVSGIWQMVTSHLRMLGSSKVGDSAAMKLSAYPSVSSIYLCVCLHHDLHLIHRHMLFLIASLRRTLACAPLLFGPRWTSSSVACVNWITPAGRLPP